eukprot:g31029.t1
MVQLLNTTIQTDVQLTPSAVKDVIAIMGINTPLIQTGVEVQLKTSTVVPVNFTARVNLRKSNIKIESPPLKQEDELFSARTRSEKTHHTGGSYEFGMEKNTNASIRGSTDDVAKN